MKGARERNCYLFVFLLWQILRISLQCGPGPASSRRSKRMKPMILYQRLPDVDEVSISGSGMFRRIVTEESKEYKELVKNYNKDVVFEGGDGKRIMTKRCREKIDVLAKLVKHQWPNVKLRVIEAYDKYGQHPPNSLHYEARAVDITTSDRDKSKIGSLGSLAFRAGFDWVYYESHSYIHASVVSENEVSLKQAECFPGSSRVETFRRGQVSLKNLQVGDEILTFVLQNGKYVEKYTKVLGFLDRVEEVRQLYHIFKTSGGVELAATKTHLVFTRMGNHSFPFNNTAQAIFANDKRPTKNSLFPKEYFFRDSASTSSLQTPGSSSVQQEILPFGSEDEMSSEESAKFAGSLKVGEHIVARTRFGPQIATIRAVSQSERHGAYAPLTEEGSLLVDGIWVSCYAKIRSYRKAHDAFFLFRTMCKFAPRYTWERLLDLYVSGLKWINNVLGVVDLY